MSIREEMERMERETLSPYATLSENSRGRDIPEEPAGIPERQGQDFTL